jgi:hypothetical protein
MPYEIKINEQIVEVSRLKPNPWNHNEQTEFMQSKLGKSLEAYGQVAEIIARENADGTLEIIDGEHRYLELVAKGESQALVNNLGAVSDDDARLLTAVMNELRGDRNPSKLSRLLNSLRDSEDWTDITDVLPFTDIEMENLLAIAGDLPKTPKEKVGDGEGKPIAWVDIKLSIHQDAIESVKAMMREGKTKLGISPEPDEALENGKLLKVLFKHGGATDGAA